MSVVVDAGPLLALGKLGLMPILPHLHDPVLVPSAVYEEVVLQGLARGYSDAYVVQQAVLREELTLVSLSDQELLDRVKTLPLGRGEKQVIHLGLAILPSWVLMDDQLARKEASHLGLRVKGTVGIIVNAYRQRIITFVIFGRLLGATQRPKPPVLASSYTRSLLVFAATTPRGDHGRIVGVAPGPKRRVASGLGRRSVPVGRQYKSASTA
ncbi:MAG: hypothetical protein GXP38_15430 [Chloroflexi bacterium]|nr:hypothetical protein [Chloroflexota bacterium]